MIMRHVAREQITVSNAVKTLTVATVVANVVYADIQVLTNDVRVTFDGSTAPVKDTTGTVWFHGEATYAGIYRIWGVHNLKNLIFIRDASADATLIVNYWGRPSV